MGENEKNTKAPKARLIVLGYEDPTALRIRPR